MKVAGIVIGIVVVVGAIFFLTRNQDSMGTNSEQKVNSPNTETVTIIYSDHGYTPRTVRVTPGTKVIFENQSSSAFWPVSDPHPVHTDLSGFDAKEPLASGKTYSYIFEKVGTWNFHDHLRPNNRGSVIVE